MATGLGRFHESQIQNPKLQAQQLWFRILEAQMETGTPYMLYKDRMLNFKSNTRPETLCPCPKLLRNPEPQTLNSKRRTLNPKPCKVLIA